MKNNIIISLIFLFCLFFNTWGIAQTLYNGIGHIYQSRQEDWSDAGLFKELNANQVFDVTLEPGTYWYEKVQSAVNKARDVSANGPSIIYFPEGTYVFTNQYTNPFELSFPDSNIIFLGDGSDKTILKFYTYACNDNFNCFDIHGSVEEYRDLNQNINKGDYGIHGDLSGVSNRDWIHFTERLFHYDPDIPLEDNEKGIVGQITKLTSKSGSDGTIKDSATKDYSTSKSLEIRKVNPVKNIGIENMTIQRFPCDKASVSGKGINIKFSFAVNCWVKGVKSENTSRHHLSVTHSSHLEISGCYFYDAIDYDNGGYGYGVTLYGSTTNSLVENNVFRHLRHAMVTGGGANDNVWIYNYSRDQYSTWNGVPYSDRDLDLHAKFPFGNLYEHNYVKLIKADDFHGLNGPYNTFVRNFVHDDKNNEPSKIRFEETDYYNVLGNMAISQSTLTAALIDPDNNSTNPFDVFGYLGILGCSHNWIRGHVGETQNVVCYDVSYFYSYRPDFLSEDYSWPSIGPRVIGYFADISQNIPARDRYFNSNIKTYNPDPTTTITTSGTLQEDENWRGVVNIMGSVYVPTGVTLTILPDTEVRFNGYYSIYVTGGTLAANGATFTAHDPVQNWDKLFFTTSSTSILENCILSYGNMALFISNVDIQVKNCTISNSNLGVYIFGSSASPTIDGCDIQDNDCAMYLTYGDPIIKNNKFNSIDESYSVRIYKGKGKFTNNTFKSRDGDCVYILGSTSIPNFEGETNGLGNYFTDCHDTYLEITGGNPELGFNTSGRAGYNLFEKDNFGGHAVNNQTGNSLYAQLNWWTTLSSQGGYPSSGSYFFGWYTIYAPVCDRPNQVGALWKGNSALDPINEEFYAAFNLYNQKQYEAASDSLERVFNKYPDHELAHQALFRLSSANTITDKSYENESLLSEIIYSKKYNESCVNVARTWFAEYHIQRGSMKEAEEIVFLSPEGSYSERELLLTLIADYTLLDDKKNAERIANIMKEKHHDKNIETDIKIAMNIAGEIEGELLPNSANQTNSESVLLTNNPNPFNNSTNILFQVSKNGLVKINVFNILGQRVKKLVNENKNVGKYQILWEGNDDNGNLVPSGLYLVNIKTKYSSKTLKISLLK